MTRLVEINRRQVAASLGVLARSRTETQAYPVLVNNLSFDILPGVFSPRYFGSTNAFAEAIKHEPGETFLEIGCGAGITSILAAKAGAGKVVAGDICRLAVHNARLNAVRHGVNDVVSVIESDVYAALTPGQRFNTIYWNTPWIPIDDSYQFGGDDERALFDPGYRQIARFVSEAPHWLEPGGRLLIGFGDFGSLHTLSDFVVTSGFEMSETHRAPGDEGGPVEFILFECRR